MQSRFLGRTGVRVSSLALGTMGFGTDADESTAAAIFARARAAGIDLFDCADVYGQGRAEEILGRLVRAAGCRDEVVLTSKAYFPTGADGNARGTSRYHLVRAVEASLRRLGTDRIDVYFLHRFDDVTPLEDTLRTVELLVQQGKILYPAVSNFAAWQTARALGIAERHGWTPIACMQPMYNLVKRQAEVEILPLAQAEGLGVLSYSPLGGGLLSGKYTRADRPASGRLVDVAMYRTRYGDAGHYDVAERFAALARQRGVSPVALAIAWVASHPAVTAPILGARDVAQLEAGLAAADVEMDAELRAQIAALSPAPPPATDRNEEASPTNYGAR
ncbi:MAG TPA: aldo/keto reductase [Nannocystaceae bacterium]|nr:aldo/keto reductase [Nannocystaceae bacterium]